MPRSARPRRHAGAPPVTGARVRGEPIVGTPEDAFRCFMGSEIELLVTGNCIRRKERQDPRLELDYKGLFEPD
jgi:carbamoyltransferase